MSETMPDIREKVGKACLTSDMGDRPGAYEVDNDRVGALGRAAAITPLGAAITRWIGAMDLASYIEVVHTLAGMITTEFGTQQDLAQRIAIQACREFGDWACTECGGRGEAVSGTGVHFVCPMCNGSTLRRYEDRQRADALQLSLLDFQAQARRLVWALDQLQRCDHIARGVAHAQLSETPETTSY